MNDAVPLIHRIYFVFGYIVLLRRYHADYEKSIHPCLTTSIDCWPDAHESPQVGHFFPVSIFKGFPLEMGIRGIVKNFHETRLTKFVWQVEMSSAGAVGGARDTLRYAG